jgi:hypothetical protein
MTKACFPSDKAFFNLCGSTIISRNYDVGTLQDTYHAWNKTSALVSRATCCWEMLRGWMQENFCEVAESLAPGRHSKSFLWLPSSHSTLQAAGLGQRCHDDV